MGYTSYSTESRSVRATANAYYKAPVDDIFIQNKVRKIHDLMNPSGVNKRECLDSEAHPNTVPIILGLDVTGSMGHIPHDLIKDGLPTLMSGMIQRGVKDASLCFVAVGDHEVDGGPLQVGQFESGDAELDMWLTRTWLEGGGGGNRGESYLLAWYFAAFHTKIDSFDKRKKKGFLFTIGDEPCLPSLPMSAVKEIMGTTAVGQEAYTAEELLAAAQKMYNVYHINVVHGSRDETAHWTQKLGKNCITVKDFTTIPKVIADIVVDKCDCVGPVPTFHTAEDDGVVPHDEEEIL